MSEPIEPRSGGARGPAGGGWPEEAAPVSGEPQMSAATRIWKVVVSPTETFRAIAARPTWVAIFVLSLLVTVGVWLLLVQKVDFAESMRQQLEQQGKEVPAGAEKFAEMSKIIYPVGAALASIVIPLIVAAIFLALNLFGGRLRYPVSFSVLLHSGIPSLLKALLSLPVLFSRESLTLQEIQGGLLKSNLAAFAPEDAGPRLLVVLGSLDVFTIWSLALMILGYSIAARVSKGAAASLVIGGWALLTLIGVLFAGLSPS